MKTKIEIPRELAEEILKVLKLDDWQQAGPLAELLAATEAPRQATDTKRSVGDAFHALTEKDWQLILEKATNSQLSTLVKSYKKIIGRYQHLCGELYQVLGALDAPAHVLDRVSDASESMVVSNTPSLLPFDQHAWPSARTAECQDPAAIVRHTKTDISERFEGVILASAILSGAVADGTKLYAAPLSPDHSGGAGLVIEYAAKSLSTITSSDGSGHADIALSVLRQAGYDHSHAKQLVDEWKSQRSWVKPECKTCGGSGIVDDGELTCSSGGVPFENGPIKCVKDCPGCLDKVKELNQWAAQPRYQCMIWPLHMSCARKA